MKGTTIGENAAEAFEGIRAADPALASLLIHAVLVYERSQEEDPEAVKALGPGLWAVLKSEADRMIRSRSEKVAVRRAAGRAGGKASGASRSKAKQNEANGSTLNQNAQMKQNEAKRSVEGEGEVEIEYIEGGEPLLKGATFRKSDVVKAAIPIGLSDDQIRRFIVWYGARDWIFSPGLPPMKKGNLGYCLQNWKLRKEEFSSRDQMKNDERVGGKDGLQGYLSPTEKEIAEWESLANQ